MDLTAKVGEPLMWKALSYEELPDSIRSIITPRRKFCNANLVTCQSRPDRIRVSVSFDIHWWVWEADPSSPGGWRVVYD